MHRSAAPLLLVTLIAMACEAPAGAVVSPTAAGRIVAVEPMQGVVTRYHLDSGAIVEIDFNTTIPVLVTTPKLAIHDLLIAGRASQGNWVIELDSGGKFGDVCFPISDPAYDRAQAIDFLVQPTGNFSSQAPFAVRLPKASSFSWLRGQEPRSDRWYIGGTTFCLNGRAEVTGELPR